MNSTLYMWPPQEAGNYWTSCTNFIFKGTGVPHGVNSKHNTLLILFQNYPRYRISHGLGKILSLFSRTPVTGQTISNLLIQPTRNLFSYNIIFHPSQFNHAEDTDSVFFRNVGTFNPLHSADRPQITTIKQKTNAKP